LKAKRLLGSINEHVRAGMMLMLLLIGTLGLSGLKGEGGSQTDKMSDADLLSTSTLFSEGFEGAFPADNWLVQDKNSNNGLDYWDDTSYRSQAGSWSGWCAQVGSQTTTTTILSENFEGVFPGSWTVEDFDSASGTDLWDDTSYRTYAGSRSAWCAEIGTKAGTPATIFYEDFEGAWPGSWIVYDSNEANGYDYWGDYYDTTHPAHQGSWDGYCADMGAHPVGCGYDDNMDAYMYRNVSLSGYSSVTLSYWYWLSCEYNYDYLDVTYFDGSWHYIDQHTGNISVWQYSSVSIPTSAIYVGLHFHSDGSICNYPGAFVDQVQLTGIPQVPNNSVHEYDNDMETYMYHSVSLSGYSSVTLSYYYWLSSENNYDYLYVTYFDTSWHDIDPHTGNSVGWQYSSVSIPTSAVYVGFHFSSDYSVCNYEGAYIDQVLLRGFADFPNSSLHLYDDYMDASMVRKYTIDASTWVSANLYYWAWYLTESSYDYCQVIVTNDAGANWYPIGEQLTGTSGWSYHTLSIPDTYLTSLFNIGFMFHSDGSIRYEGVYLDSIVMQYEILSSPIYIRADGSVDPPSAPILRNVNLYTLTDNIYSYAPTAIVIEKNGITLDGAGYTIQGSSGVGIDLSGRTDVTVKNAVIKSFSYGIKLSNSLSNFIQGNSLRGNQIGILVSDSSSNTLNGNIITKSQNYSVIFYDDSYHNTLSGNNISDNYHGVWLWWSPNNLLSANTIAGNNGTGVWLAEGSSNNTLIGGTITNNHYYGVKLEHCSNNRIYHNNFMSNSPAQASILDSANVWDDDYPSGGNYWNNYAGADLYSGPSQDVIGNDGIGDTDYVIGGSNRDNYPLKEPWTPTRMLPPPTEWTKTYEGTSTDVGYSVVETSDGGYAIAGYTNSFGSGSQVYLVKTFADGTMAWNKTYGGTGADWGYSLVETSDGGYAIAGYTNSFGSGSQVYLVKTFADGTMAWNKTYGGTGDERGYSVVETSDGGYAIAGYTNSFGSNYQVYLVKTFADGTMAWNKTYGGTNYDYGLSVVRTSDGGYAIAAQTNSFGLSWQVYLVKTFADGTMAWNKTYGGTNSDLAQSVVQTSDGGYAIAGYTNSYGIGTPTYNNFYLVKTNSAGSMQWNKTYGGTSNDIGAYVIQTDDGGYAMAGYTNSYGAGGYDFWLVKTDSAGTKQWNKTCGGPNADYAYSVTQTSDGGYALAGKTNSFGAGGDDMWLVKVSGPVHPSTEYPWPMFQHDPRRTGSTESPGPNTNHMQWNYTTGGMVDSPPTVVDGRVYFGSEDNKTYCLDALTGAFIWSYTTGGDVGYSSPAVIDGRVYVGSRDHKVHCLSSSTGTKIWSYTTGQSVMSSPAVVDGRVYVGSWDNKTYCLDALTGVHLWSYTTGGGVFSSPAVVDGRVYVGSEDCKVYCLDALTGVHIWKYTTGYIVYSSPAVADGKVYVGSYDHNVYALDAATGAKIWNYTTGHWVGSSPAVADGRVYIGSFDDKLYCLNASTGAYLWSYLTGSYVFSSPAVAGGKVYVTSNDRKIYCLNALTGVVTWSYTHSTTGRGGTSPAVADGMVYVGSEDGRVYAFGNTVKAEDYPTIQAAVDAAPPKATVIIQPGTYYESIVINKPLTIMGRKGSSTDFEGGGTGIAIKITGTYDVTVTNVVVTHWNKGILIENSFQCNIYSNVMSCMVGSGIALTGSSTVSNHIYSNNIYSNNIAINITTSSTSNTIHDNTISLNSIGINIESNGNTVYANTISQNNIGIKVLHSSNSIIYWNNFINNIQAHLDLGYANTWDDGFPAGGNYWSDYKDRYPNASEFGTSGIWNTPYEIDGFNVDNYPLMYPAQEINVTKVTPFKTIVGQGYNIRINVTITNRGKYTEVIKVTLHASTTHSTQLTNIMVPSRTSKNITITWNTLTVPYGTYPISAEVDPVPGETDVANNMRIDGSIKVTIIGDVNGDGRVDVIDLYAVGKASGSSSSTSNWNPNCDFNDDDTINSLDLLDVSKNYGKMI